MFGIGEVRLWLIADIVVACVLRPRVKSGPSRAEAIGRLINHERMPVLLSDPADFETWLSGSPEEAFKLARTYAAEQMRIVQSGSERRDLLAAP